MYIFKNALKSILRAKVRNTLILIIAFIITVSACIALSIRQSAETTRKVRLGQLSITGQISINRQAVMNKATQAGEDPRSALQSVQALTIEDMLKYSKSENVSDFYYTLTSSLGATEGLSPVDTNGATTSNTNTSTSNNPKPQDDRGNFFGMGNQGDFTVIGYSSYNAMTSFIEGTSKVVEGTIFEENTSENQAIISDELATLNSLKVGDTIKLINPNNEEEIVDIFISGIYNNSEAASLNSNNMRGFNVASEPANQIYMSYTSLKAIIDKSKTNAVIEVDAETGRESSTALRSQETGTYVFSNVEAFEAFREDAIAMGLDTETYSISSTDLNAYEQSLIPLQNLSNYATYFLLVVLVIGGAILVVFNIFTIRERKYEIGVLAAIGMKKTKVALQFMSEVFLVTIIAIIIGTSVGASVSAPVANKLLEDQVTSVQAANQETMNNFGGGFQGKLQGNRTNLSLAKVDYIESITARVDNIVLLQLMAIGVILTIVSSAAALISILRYEPLKILSNRS